jgi:LysM repeat protein
VSIPKGVTLSGSAGSFTVALGPTMPSLSDGYSGWNEVTRPRRRAMTEWSGVAARKASLQVLFDGFADGASVQGDVDALMKAYTPNDGTTEPPTLKVSGAWPIPSTVPWVVNGVTWDEWIRDTSGDPVRVLMSLSFLEYVSPDPIMGTNTVVTRAKAANAAKPAAKAKAKTPVYVVKPNDTLSGIAAEKLGDWRRYTEIAKLNGIRDPNRIPVGATLKLP